MKICCITIGGTSESSRDKEDQLNTVVNNVWKDIKKLRLPGELDLFSIPSHRRKKNLKEIEKILAKGIGGGYDPGYDYILLIGKSQGAIRLLQFCWKYDGLLKKFNRCGLITIDPHQWTWIGDKNRRLRYVDKFIKHWNIFQRNKWPRGGYCVDAINTQLNDKIYDHWNIVTCQSTKFLINEMFKKILKRGPNQTW